MIRVYGVRHFASELLDVIKETESPLKVLLGAWLAQEAVYDQEGKLTRTHSGARKANLEEIEQLVKLANAYPDIVVAVVVGNETQVEWSGHRMHPETLIDHIRQVRAKVDVPVTTGDDYNFWNKERSLAISSEIDFITTHLYALWNGASLDDAISWTEKHYEEARKLHPGVPVVIGEAGWATSKADSGLQKRLMKAPAGPEQQMKFLGEFYKWSTQKKIPSFYFSAFDESWKLGEEKAGAEGHWGIFKEDRRPKKAAFQLSNILNGQKRD